MSLICKCSGWGDNAKPADANAKPADANAEPAEPMQADGQESDDADATGSGGSNGQTQTKEKNLGMIKKQNK